MTTTPEQLVQLARIARAIAAGDANEAVSVLVGALAYAVGQCPDPHAAAIRVSRAAIGLVTQIESAPARTKEAARG